jgi:excisionase family DNA binding protein
VPLPVDASPMNFPPTGNPTATPPIGEESALFDALSQVIDSRVDARTEFVVERLSARIAEAVAQTLFATRSSDAEELLLTIPAAARLLSLSRSTVYQLIKRGEIAAVKVGSARRIRMEALQAFQESLANGPTRAVGTLGQEHPRRSVPPAGDPWEEP